MNALRIGAAALLMLLGASVAVMNWGCVIAGLRNRRKDGEAHHSTVSLVSLVAAASAYAIYPFDPKGWIGLIPLLDPGNWMLVIGLPIAFARKALEKKATRTGA